jgi:hypothetical protein
VKLSGELVLMRIFIGGDKPGISRSMSSCGVIQDRGVYRGWSQGVAGVRAHSVYHTDKLCGAGPPHHRRGDRPDKIGDARV